MDGERDFYIENKETKLLVQRYERMLRKNEQHFFDVIELESIIDYYLEDYKIKKASQAVDFALNIHPNSIEIQIKQAQVLFDVGDYKKAHKLLLKLEKIETTNTDVFLLLGNTNVILEDYKNAHKYFELALKFCEDDEIEILLAIAITLEQTNRYTDAISYLNKAYKLDRSYMPVIYEMAFCYDKMGDNENSIKFYKRYIDQEPFSRDAWYNLGLVYNKINKYGEAIDAYDFAIAIDDKFATAYFNKANTLANSEIYIEAISVYKEYLNIIGDVAEAYFYIAECYERLEEYDLAIEYYLNTLKFDKKFADAIFGIGYIHYSQNNYSESQKYIKKAIKADDTNPEYWFYLGLVNSKLNMERSSISAFKKASELDPFDKDIWLSYSELYFNNKKFDDAINIIKKAVTFDNNAQLNYRLAAYYYSKEDIGMAIDKFETGLSLDFNEQSNFFELCPKAKDNKDISDLIDKYKS